jgi:trans-AT polyketide synthase/acyltransferase/oxidoreductase domain-containing protein
MARPAWSASASAAASEVGGSFQAPGRRLSLSGRPAALYPEWLGDRGFLEMHGLRFPYVAGAMARGIASEALVIEMARAGMLGFFGAGGLSPARVEQALATLTEAPWATGCPGAAT